MEYIEKDGKSGFKLHKDYNYIGQSSDGFVLVKGCRELVEVKIVVTADFNFPTWKNKHMSQMQLGMQIHDCSHCHFIVYDGKYDMNKNIDENHIHAERIERDEKWFNNFFDERKTGKYKLSCLVL